MIELVDYPAIAPAPMQRQIDTFRAACIRVRDAAEQHRKRALITVAVRHADALRARRDELEQMLAEGDQWLVLHYSAEDEDQWLAWEAEYRAIVDALTDGARIAFGGTSVTQARMWEEVA